MKRFSFYCLVLFSVIYAPAKSNPLKSNPHARIKNLVEKSKQNNNQAPWPSIKRIFSKNKKALIRKKQALIGYSWYLFSQLPGFVETMARICTYKDAKGPLFEFESAVHKHKSTQVVAFNQVMKSPDTTIEREFDVICEDDEGNRLFIECKAVNWNFFDERIQEQLLDQRNIVRGYQKIGIPARYLLMSKQYIPDDCKTWMQAHDIPYEELDHLATHDEINETALVH